MIDPTDKEIERLKRDNADLRAALGRVEKLADAMAKVPDYTVTAYDRGRVDQRHMDETDLRAALEGTEQ